MPRNPECKDCTLRGNDTKHPCLWGNYSANLCSNSNPTIMVVGLNPNPLEDMFATAGRGDLQNIITMFAGQVNIYYTNLTKCRSKSKVNVATIRKCLPYFEEEYNTVKPTIIVALGEHVRKYLLGDTEQKRVTRGAGYLSEKYGWIIPTWDGYTLFKQPWKADEVYTDLYIAMKFATTKKDKSRPHYFKNSLRDLIGCLPPVTRDSANAKYLSIDIETDGNSTDDTLDPTKSWPWVLTITAYTESIKYNFLYDKNAFDEGMWDEVAEIIKKSKLPIVGQNFKFDLKFLRFHCINWDDIEVTFDTQLAHHIINENVSHSLNHLEWRYLPEFAGHKSEVNLGVKTAHEHDQKVLQDYAVKDTISTALVATHLRAALSPEQVPLVTMVSKASSVLASTEAFGCRIDAVKLQEQLAHVGGTAFQLEDNIREEATLLGIDEFNPNSPTQVQGLLYHTLRLPEQKGDDGFVSTDDTALECLLEECSSDEQLTMVQSLRMHREWEKARSTLAGIKERLYHDNNGQSFIRTEYRMSSVVTGRMSSANPNLQNIPRDGRIKSIFVPRDGHVFVEVDYKQAEYRVAAQMAQDAKMIAVLMDGIDFHTATVEALAALGCTVDRDTAKHINFAILYGAGDKRVATLAKMTLEQVQFIQQMLKKAFPDFDNYFKSLPERARRNGNSVTGLFGRKRTIPYLSSSHKWWRSRGERQIVNSPVQGGASDLTLNAIVGVNDYHRELHKRWPQVVLTVHDSIIWEVYDKQDTIDEFCGTVKSIMERQEYPDFNLKFNVPIQVDLEVKRTCWGEKKEKVLPPVIES